MAYPMTREEVLAQVLRENDEEYSAFDDSESDIDQAKKTTTMFLVIPLTALEVCLANYRQMWK